MKRETLMQAEFVIRRLEKAEGRVRYAENPTSEILPNAWNDVITPETAARVRDLVLADMRAERDRIAAELEAL